MCSCLSDGIKVSRLGGPGERRKQKTKVCDDRILLGSLDPPNIVDIELSLTSVPG